MGGAFLSAVVPGPAGARERGAAAGADDGNFVDAIDVPDAACERSDARAVKRGARSEATASVKRLTSSRLTPRVLEMILIARPTASKYFCVACAMESLFRPPTRGGSNP